MKEQTFYDGINEALPDLLERVLKTGHVEGSRNGKTRELLMQRIVLERPGVEFCAVAGRKASVPAQIAEAMWVLAGRNDIEWLSHYLPRAAEFSDDGKTWRGGYGPRIRKWVEGNDGRGEEITIDQLAHVVDLLKEDPDTRRAVIQIYDPAVDTQPGKDIPCNNWIHFIQRGGELHAHVATRSNDLMWGWSGVNYFEWSVLLSVVASMTGMEMGSLTFSITSLHLYKRHWEKAKRIVEQNALQLWHRGPVSNIKSIESLDKLIAHWFLLESRIRKGEDVRNEIRQFRDEMMRSWLWALYAWHHGNFDANHFPYKWHGTTLYQALKESPPRKEAEPPAPRQTQMQFTEFAAKLHEDKHKVYGNSWKKRGEMLGIMANIARKVDRLGVGGAGDTAADTAIDLLLYLLKYETWLEENVVGGVDNSQGSITEGEVHANVITRKLVDYENAWLNWAIEELVGSLKDKFEALYPKVEEKRVDRHKSVRAMILPAYVLAVKLWDNERKDALVATPQDNPATRNATRMWNPEEGTE